MGSVRVAVNYDVDDLEESERFRECYDTVITMTFDSQTRELTTAEKSKLENDVEYIHQRVKEFREKAKEHPSSFNSIMNEVNPLTNEKFTEEDAKSIMAAMIIGSYHTTAVGTMWVLYRCAKHPQMQQKMFEEIAPLFEKGGTIEDLAKDPASWSKCVYLRAFIEETFRCDPGGSFSARSLPNGAVLSDYTFPPNSEIFIPIPVLSSDERLFENPLTFDPERFIRDDSLYSEMQTFGFGVRKCPGETYGRRVVEMMVIGMVQKFKFQWIKETDRVVKVEKFANSAKTDPGVVLKLEKRT